MSYLVEVIESSDAFTIKIDQFHKSGSVSTIFYHFDQESSVKDLVDVFVELGIEARHVEDY